jgi:hypothetical protein
MLIDVKSLRTPGLAPIISACAWGETTKMINVRLQVLTAASMKIEREREPSGILRRVVS